MNSIGMYFGIFFDSALKIAPAVIAALVAFWLWRAKEDRERTNDAIRACWNYAFFCDQLSLELQNEPAQVGHIDAASLTKYLDIYFDLHDVNPHIGEVFQIFARWKHRAYFGSTSEAPELIKSVSALESYAQTGRALATLLSARGQKTPISRSQLRSISIGMEPRGLTTRSS